VKPFDTICDTNAKSVPHVEHFNVAGAVSLIVMLPLLPSSAMPFFSSSWIAVLILLCLFVVVEVRAENEDLRNEYCGAGDELGVEFGDHVAESADPGELLRDGEEKIEVGEPTELKIVLLLKEEDCRRRNVSGDGRGKESVGRR
jgi:hypothetical protein